MTIRAKCSGCGKTIKGGDDWADRTGKCPNCNGEVRFAPQKKRRAWWASASGPAFYWSYKDTHVILTDNEVQDLLNTVAEDPVEKFKYFTDRDVRRKLERRIFQHLENSLRGDPEAFNRQYVLRGFEGEEAQEMFPHLVDIYGRITKRAMIGQDDQLPLLEHAIDNIYHLGEVAHPIILLEHGRWPWSQRRPSGVISVPVSTIQHLYGAVNNFYVVTTNVAIKFHPDFVRVSIRHKSDE